MRNVEVSAAIDAAKTQRAQKVGLSAEYVLENLQEVVERCMQRAPVMVREGRHMVQKVDEDGNNVWEFNSNGANRALELLGKHLEMFTEKVKNSHAFEGLTDEQLEARFAALTSQQPFRRPSPEDAEKMRELLEGDE